MKKLWLAVITFFVLLTFSEVPVVWGGRGELSVPPTARPQKVLKRYANLLLLIKGVRSVSTTQCETREGLEVDCIVVQVGEPADLSRVQEVYPNPLVLDGVPVHFSDRDPLPNKGGITINN